MRIYVSQWKCSVRGKVFWFFTPNHCDVDTAYAIAIGTHGREVTDIEDEGTSSVDFDRQEELFA